MNILSFFAHPDDETMLRGGILALLAQNGAKVHFLSATSVEGGEIGEPPRTTRSVRSLCIRESRTAAECAGGDHQV